MKKILSALFLLGMVSVSFANAQDLIVLKDASEIEAKVEAVTQSEISYHKWSNPDGPLYTISKAEVFYIKYKNGDKEIISEQPAAAAAAVPVAASQQATDENKKPNKVGAGINSVDARSIHKVMFQYSPMTWKELTTGEKIGTFHNVGLLYTNSQVIAKVPLYIEFGAGFNYLTLADGETKTVYGKTYEVSGRYNLFSMTIPVNIAYALSFKEGQMHLVPYTGLYGRINLAGSYKTKSSVNGEVINEEKYNLFSSEDMKGLPFTRFQLGWQIGVSYDYRMLNVNIGYGLDFLALTSFKTGDGNRLGGFNFGVGVKF